MKIALLRSSAKRTAKFRNEKSVRAAFEGNQAVEPMKRGKYLQDDASLWTRLQMRSLSLEPIFIRELDE